VGQLTLLVLVLAWGAPVIALEWAFAWRTLTAAWRQLAIATGMATLYLGLAGMAAIHNGIWAFDDARTLPLTFGSFVFEQWVFTLVTNLMVVQTIILAHDKDTRTRIARLRRR
jgi:lycopene cyclase domain-containing protein